MKLKHSILLFLLLVFLIPETVFANSNIRYYEGKTASGVVSLGENPLIVTHESLSFDVQDFPDLYVEFKDDYHAEYTAEYTISNPTDLTVKVGLAFPVGVLPNYVSDSYRKNVYGKKETNRLLLNGEPVEYQMRYSYDRYHSLSYEETLKNLSDTYIEDGFFTKDLPVTRLTYSLSSVPGRNNPVQNFAFRLPVNASCQYLFPYVNSVGEEREGYREIRVGGEGKTSLSFCLLGTLNEYPTCDALGKDDELIETISPEAETTDLSHLLLEDASAYPEMSEVDLYNIRILSLMEQRNHQEPALLGDGFSFDVNLHSYLWYQYELEIKPHATVVHSVTAPLFPDIDASYTMPVYSYEYLLSPAKGWGDFEGLDISVQSSRYLLSSSLGEFEKGEDGIYRMHFDQLPQQELTFELCETLHPQKESNPYFVYFLMLFLPVILIILALLIFIIRRIVKGNKKLKK